MLSLIWLELDLSRFEVRIGTVSRDAFKLPTGNGTFEEARDFVALRDEITVVTDDFLSIRRGVWEDGGPFKVIPFHTFSDSSCANLTLCQIEGIENGVPRSILVIRSWSGSVSRFASFGNDLHSSACFSRCRRCIPSWLLKQSTRMRCASHMSRLALSPLSLEWCTSSGQFSNRT